MIRNISQQLEIPAINFADSELKQITTQNSNTENDHQLIQRNKLQKHISMQYVSINSEESEESIPRVSAASLQFNGPEVPLKQEKTIKQSNGKQKSNKKSKSKLSELIKDKKIEKINKPNKMTGAL